MSNFHTYLFTRNPAPFLIKICFIRKIRTKVAHFYSLGALETGHLNCTHDACRVCRGHIAEIMLLGKTEISNLMTLKI